MLRLDSPINYLAEPEDIIKNVSGTNFYVEANNFLHTYNITVN